MDPNEASHEDEKWSTTDTKKYAKASTELEMKTMYTEKNVHWSKNN
jgi:hypothetical protein